MYPMAPVSGRRRRQGCAEALGDGGLRCAAGAGLQEIVQGSARVGQRFAVPAVPGEEESNVEAGLAGSVNVSGRLVVPDGPLVVAERLANISGTPIDDTELVFPAAPGRVVVGTSQVQGFLVAAQCVIQVLQQHRFDLAGDAGCLKARNATLASEPTQAARPRRSVSASRPRLWENHRSAWSRSRSSGTYR